MPKLTCRKGSEARFKPSSATPWLVLLTTILDCILGPTSSHRNQAITISTHGCSYKFLVNSLDSNPIQQQKRLPCLLYSFYFSQLDFHLPLKAKSCYYPRHCCCQLPNSRTLSLLVTLAQEPALPSPHHSLVSPRDCNISISDGARP